MVIKAIETAYKGLMFRSRLEARWAMFFDNMGYRWEYEPEGYILENGSKYIPDFKVAIYMPRLNRTDYFYVEVKPLRNLKPQEFEKARLLVKGGDLPLLLVQGIPDFRNYYLFLNYEKEGFISEVKVIDFLFEENYYGIYPYVASELPYPIAFSNNINQKNAIEKAKQFRFEHTKKGGC